MLVRVQGFVAKPSRYHFYSGKLRTSEPGQWRRFAHVVDEVPAGFRYGIVMVRAKVCADDGMLSGCGCRAKGGDSVVVGWKRKGWKGRGGRESRLSIPPRSPLPCDLAGHSVLGRLLRAKAVVCRALLHPEGPQGGFLWGERGRAALSAARLPGQAAFLSSGCCRPARAHPPSSPRLPAAVCVCLSQEDGVAGWEARMRASGVEPGANEFDH